MLQLSKATDGDGLHDREAVGEAQWESGSIRVRFQEVEVQEVEVTTLVIGGACKREELLSTGGWTQLTLRTWVSASPWPQSFSYGEGALGQHKGTSTVMGTDSQTWVPVLAQCWVPRPTNRL